MKSKKLIFSLILVLVFSFFLIAEDENKITGGVVFYDYNFFWQNSDFNSKTNDKDAFSYIHLDFHINADLGSGVSFFASIGSWGQFGQHPVWGIPSDPRATMLEGYLNFDKLIGPLSVKIGKFRFLYGDGIVAFDGGEDGTLGINLYSRSKSFDIDLFYRKPFQGGGIAEVYYPGTQTSIGERDEVDLSIHVLGVYPTIKLSNDKLKISPYLFYREQGENKPLWTGLRIEASVIKNLSVKAEYVSLSGAMNETVNYKGYAFLNGVQYNLENGFFLGGNVYRFSGDDDKTADNELYISIIDSPFANGFYQWWPGLGPAHLMTTGYGFSCIAEWNPTMTNLNVFDIYAGYSGKKFSFRTTYWNYSRNKLMSGQENKAMGSEISFFGTYNIRNIVTIGTSIGYWTPGDYFKKDLGLGNNASGVLGGFVFLYKDFNFKIK